MFDDMAEDRRFAADLLQLNATFTEDSGSSWPKQR
jgi:hypothetical protein